MTPGVPGAASTPGVQAQGIDQGVPASSVSSGAPAVSVSSGGSAAGTARPVDNRANRKRQRGIRTARGAPIRPRRVLS
jgi:hypothetical protein